MNPRTPIISRWLGVAAGVLLAAWPVPHGLGSEPNAKPDPATEKKIMALIEILHDPDARGERLKETQKAIEELTKIGRPAVPQLVKVIVDADPKYANTFKGNGAAYSALTLDEIGKPALEYVRFVWKNLDEVGRWKLMRFRGQHDYAAVLDFALASLESKSNEVVARAVRYLGQYKEAKAREPLLEILSTAVASTRWEVIDALARIGGKGVMASLVKLLAPDSWAAKGEGLPKPLGDPPPWWPDGRTRVIEALHILRAVTAEMAIVKVLQEKGKGKAYLGSFIIPFLSDHGGRESIVELKHIAEANPSDLWRDVLPPKLIQERAKQAIGAITRRIE